MCARSGDTTALATFLQTPPSKFPSASSLASDSSATTAASVNDYDGDVCEQIKTAAQMGDLTGAVDACIAEGVDFNEDTWSFVVTQCMHQGQRAHVILYYDALLAHGAVPSKNAFQAVIQTHLYNKDAPAVVRRFEQIADMEGLVPLPRSYLRAIKTFAKEGDRATVMTLMEDLERRGMYVSPMEQKKVMQDLARTQNGRKGM